MTDEIELQTISAVVLCGGRSSRMGRDKAWLSFGGQTFLQNTCAKLTEVASPVVVVAAAEQQLPEISSDIRIVRDLVPDQGPLGGFLNGLEYLRSLSEHQMAPDLVWLTTCDAAFCRPDIIRYLRTQLADFQAVIIRHNGHLNPLMTLYRFDSLSVVDDLFAAGARRMQDVAQRLNVRVIDAEQLRGLDPSLSFLCSVNTPEEFAAAATLYRNQ